MNIKCNNEARSYNNSCSGKAISITYSENMFVTLGNQYGTRMRHIVICCLSGPAIFFHIIASKARFSEEKKLLNIGCVLIFSSTFVFSF